ncbi:MAG: class I SAM-dependent methyltransferase [Novosphingobium sp.]
MALYDIIGVDYERLRRADPRIMKLIYAALGDAQSVVNVGAGTGSYEPIGRQVTAVEPSAEMIAKRALDAAPAVQARAEALPFADGSFDAAMAVLTVHHWSDKAEGLREMRRVSRGAVVILTHDPAHRPWLTDYLPELVALDEKQMPPMAFYEEHLGPVSIEQVLVPHDCVDGFLYAFWRRPEVYLDARYRNGSSSFWALGDALAPGLRALENDLASGIWHRRYGHLSASDTHDVGYRLVVSKS